MTKYYMNERYEEGASKIADALLSLRDKVKNMTLPLYVFVHRSVDGDCMGSSVGMVSILRKLGIESFIAMPEKLPYNMSFLKIESYLSYDLTDIHRDIVISVDCSRGDRMGSMGVFFDNSSTKISVDHHEISGITDGIRWIDPISSSCSEMVYYIALILSQKLEVELEELLTKEAINSLFAGLYTDTGGFKYSNTRPETLMVSGELLRLGADPSAVSYNLFDRKRPEAFFLSSRLCSEARIVNEGKMAIVTVNGNLFDEYGCSSDDISDVVAKLRDIDGVEFSIVLREDPNGDIRGSLRSREYFNCADFASSYGGGGHIHAAGLTIKNEGAPLDLVAIAEDIIIKAGELL